MKDIYLKKILNSHWCQIVFLMALVIGYFFIPRTVFSSDSLILAVIFLITFSLVITCLARNTKEKILLARSQKIGIVSILAIILGFSALQMCAVNSVCLASVGAGILSIIFPGIMFSFLEKYAVIILLLSISTQIFALYSMGCFKLK